MFDMFNRVISQRGYTRYLEIGVSNGGTFYNIECQVKHGVDPNNKDMLYPITSDEFFENCNQTYDIVFIDGDHECNQVLRDIDNSIKHLSPNGIIFVKEDYGLVMCGKLSQSLETQEKILQLEHLT
jgi:hypothetical protein